MAHATHCDYVDPDTDEECALVDTQLVQVYWIEAEHRPSAVAGWAGELKVRHRCPIHLAQGEAEGGCQQCPLTRLSSGELRDASVGFFILFAWSVVAVRLPASPVEGEDAPVDIPETRYARALDCGYIVFEDTGEHELKGVPDRWHLCRVVA